MSARDALAPLPERLVTGPQTACIFAVIGLGAVVVGVGTVITLLIGWALT